MKPKTKAFSVSLPLLRSTLVIVLFVAAMTFTHFTINKVVGDFDRREFYSARLEEVSQFGWEYRSFYEMGAALAYGEPWATRKDLNRALDIFWSRTHTLSQADYIEAYDDPEKPLRLVKDVKDALPEFEKAANLIVAGDPESLAPLRSLYLTYRKDILDFAQAAYNQRRLKAAAALQSQFETTDTLKDLNLWLGVGGLLGFFYLLYELFQTRRLADKLHASNRKVRELAETDFLTGLYNRRSFSDRIDRLQAENEAASYCLLYLDLDGFKPINDRLGHIAGDVVLREIGSRLNSLSDDIFIARLGGDEFAILSSGGADEAQHLCERVLEVISARIDCDGATISISGSIGITVVEDGRKPTVSELMHEADLALYEAKGRGRSGFRFYHPQMSNELRRRVQIEEELARAIETQSIEIVFQPIVGEEDGNIVALEALSRWVHPISGAIGPEEMFDIAEEIGLGPALGSYVLEQACKSAKPILDAMPELALSINVRPSHAAVDEFVGDCLRVVSVNGLSNSGLVLEFTEDDMATNYSRIGKNLAALTDAGVRIAIDDFGKGYSSYARLMQFPFSLLKLDRSMIAHIETDARVATMVSALVSMTRKLGAELIVEGVETGAQHSMLQKAGVTRFQGFLFATPMAPKDLLSWLDICPSRRKRLV